MPKLSSEKLIQRYKERAADCGAELMADLIRETHPDGYAKMDALSWRYLTLMLAAYFRVGAKETLIHSHIDVGAEVLAESEIALLRELGWLNESDNSS